MVIILSHPLTTQEIRVLQEFRRLTTDTLALTAIQAIKHPAGGGAAPAQTLAGKGYLTAEEGGARYVLTEKAREFLSHEPKPHAAPASAPEESAADET